jgi:hypothetical protein
MAALPDKGLRRDRAAKEEKNIPNQLKLCTWVQKYFGGIDYDNCRGYYSNQGGAEVRKHPAPWGKFPEIIVSVFCPGWNGRSSGAASFRRFGLSPLLENPPHKLYTPLPPPLQTRTIACHACRELVFWKWRLYDRHNF